MWDDDDVLVPEYTELSDLSEQLQSEPEPARERRGTIYWTSKYSDDARIARLTTVINIVNFIGIALLVAHLELCWDGAVRCFLTLFFP